MCAGDLYGAIGSPVRLSRTVVVGRRQELVQRLLYVLTYFIRCSELLETHMLDSVEDEAIVMPGSLITTSLRRGEVEESDYVLVTVHKPSGDYLSQSVTAASTVAPEAGSYPSDTHSMQSSTYTDTDTCLGPDDEAPGQGSQSDGVAITHGVHCTQASAHTQTPHTFGTVPLIRTEDVSEPTACKEIGSPRVEARVETVVCVGSTSPRDPTLMLGPESDQEQEGGSETGVKAELDLPLGQEEPQIGGIGIKVLRSCGIPLEKKPPDKSLVAPYLSDDEEPATKVTFLIGDSMSPESDTESRQRKLEEELKKHKKHLKEKEQKLQQQHKVSAEQKSEPKSNKGDQTKTNEGPKDPLPRISSKMPKWSPAPEECMDLFDEYFSDDNPVETRTIDDLSKKQEKNQSVTQSQPNQSVTRSTELPEGQKGKEKRDNNSSFHNANCSPDSCRCSPAVQDKGIVISVTVPQGDTNSGDLKKVAPVNDWEIPRNESSDSALGDSESEETGQELQRHEEPYYRDDPEEWQDEMEVPFPG